MLFNSQLCVNQSIFVLVYISTSEPSLANSDYLRTQILFPVLPASLSSFKVSEKEMSWILYKDNLSGSFFPSSLDLNQLLNIFNFTFSPDLDPDSISSDLFISFLISRVLLIYNLDSPFTNSSVRSPVVYSSPFCSTFLHYL